MGFHDCQLSLWNFNSPSPVSFFHSHFLSLFPSFHSPLPILARKSHRDPSSCPNSQRKGLLQRHAGCSRRRNAFHADNRFSFICPACMLLFEVSRCEISRSRFSPLLFTSCSSSSLFRDIWMLNLLWFACREGVYKEKRTRKLDNICVFRDIDIYTG